MSAIDRISRDDLAELGNRLKRRSVSTASGCIEWTGYRMPLGYGQVGLPRRQGVVTTHRAAWIIEHGTIPAGLFVCHRCDNPPCLNTAHLFLGTARDNNEDKRLKGRAGGPRGLHNANGRLLRAEVDAIRARVGEPYASIAADYSITPQYVGQLIRGQWRNHE